MSTGKRDEKAERAIVERMERGVAASEADVAAQRPYRRLAAAIAEQPPLPPPAGWQERVLAAIDGAEALRPSARPRRWRRPLVLAASVTLVAAALLLLWRRPPDGPTAPARRGAQLAVLILHGDIPQRGSAAVGDRLRATVSASGAHVELRIYRDDHELVLRCPGDARCQSDPAGPSGELPLTLPGRYRVVSLVSTAELPAPRSGGFDEDQHLVSMTGGRVTHEIVDVQ